MTPPSRHEDLAFLTRALELALDNTRTGGGGPFGAVLVCDGRIVAEGSNHVVPECDPTAHAEVVALRLGARALGSPHLEQCTLYSSCEPCPMCLAAAYWAHIPRLVYAMSRKEASAMGFSDAEIYDEVACLPDKRHMRCEQVPHALCPQVVEAWNGAATRKPY